MKFQGGNAKLGDRVVTLSRPVGDTCPSSCVFLGDGCYAERTERLRPNVRAASSGNLILDRNRLRSQLVYAHATGAAVRLLVSGDLMLDGKLDKAFLADLRWAVESITAKGGDLPPIWLYTHVHLPEVAALASLGIVVYASCSSVREMRKARKAGFRLFAYADRGEKHVKRFPSNGNGREARLAAWAEQAPAVATIDGERFVLCPEQRKRGRVTCTGSLDSKACQLCVRGRASVLFARH